MTSYPASSAPVLAVPKWLADVLTCDEFTSHGANGSSSNYTAGNGFSPGPIPGGSRDDALYKFACWLRGQGYEEAEAKRRMGRRWRDCEPGDHPYTLAEALEKVIAPSGTTRPATAGAPKRVRATAKQKHRPPRWTLRRCGMPDLS